MNLIKKLKTLLYEVTNRLRISSMKCLEPFNFMKITDLNSESFLRKIGVFIGSNNSNNDAALINWSNKSNIFRKTNMLSPQTITTSIHLKNDGSFAIRINSLNSEKRITFGISKFELDLNDCVDFISENEDKMIVLFSKNDNANKHQYMLPLKEFNSSSKISFIINEGFLTLLLNDSQALVNKFQIPFNFPFFPLVTLYQENDEVEII